VFDAMFAQKFSISVESAWSARRCICSIAGSSAASDPESEAAAPSAEGGAVACASFPPASEGRTEASALLPPVPEGDMEASASIAESCPPSESPAAGEPDP
jgi:hypothetical protein